MFDITKIKPKQKGKSDKYSWNLYRFLNNLIKDKDEGQYIQKQLEIHWLHHSRWNGEWLEFNPEKLHLMQILIIPFGINHDRSFYSMGEVLRRGRAELFYLPWGKEEMTDITDWFFTTYEKDGRCIFDREHNKWLLGDENRFTYVNNTRRCNWCGKWQYKEIEKEQIIKRKECFN